MIYARSEIVEAQWVVERRGSRAFAPSGGLFDPQPQHGTRSVDHLSGLGDGRVGAEPIGEGHARRPLPKRPAAAREFACQGVPRQMGDDRNLDAVEQLVPIAKRAALSLTHMAMEFVTQHPGVTSAILGPRTMAQLG
jgi:aryl-alcohol dehydrogenase-like predicted oxidoreductase